jgi:hypothetical protein
MNRQQVTLVLANAVQREVVIPITLNGPPIVAPYLSWEPPEFVTMQMTSTTNRTASALIGLATVERRDSPLWLSAVVSSDPTVRVSHVLDSEVEFDSAESDLASRTYRLTLESDVLSGRESAQYVTLHLTFGRGDEPLTERDIRVRMPSEEILNVAPVKLVFDIDSDTPPPGKYVLISERMSHLPEWNWTLDGQLPDWLTVTEDDKVRAATGRRRLLVKIDETVREQLTDGPVETEVALSTNLTICPLLKFSVKVQPRNYVTQPTVRKAVTGQK